MSLLVLWLPFPMPATTGGNIHPDRGPPVAELLTSLEMKGVLTLWWSTDEGAVPLPRNLILTAASAPMARPSGNLAAWTWLGASLVHVVREETGATTLVLVPACLKVLPFVAPPTYPMTGDGVMDSVDCTGVALLRGGPPSLIIRSLFRTFLSCVIAALTPAAVAPSQVRSLSAETQRKLIHWHWERLQAFVPANLVNRLPNLGTAEKLEEQLSCCAWCIVGYPGGDPFPGVVSTGEPAAPPTGVDALLTALVAGVMQLPPFYLLPDFLVVRFAAPLFGLRSFEPHCRPEAAAAATEVKALVQDTLSEMGYRDCVARVEQPISPPVHSAVVFQKASSLRS